MSHRTGTLPAARLQKGLSQTELGQLVGLPQTHISGIETGRVVPRYDTLLDLVRVLGHDLLLAPRDLVPLVEAVLHERRPSTPEDHKQPLYQPDEDDAGQLRPTSEG